ncbi:peroxisomal sarcosine oxidase-like [Neocloeon triangulifer]|uniref:peroxisomal sarcosine oxidase-like n=1 Tax=Neocloeon triangulifer TaxID=2078957 RepID=UPI00286F289D|nr:peroxisomal sarcosine oxidase-like [Neocloeon triangulifer]
MDRFDYVVVGAGIEGSWTAYQLIRAKSKPSVLLLDQFTLPHNRGSSHGQSRIIRHAYAESFHAAMMPPSYEEWFQLEKDSGEHLFVQKPLLCVADETGFDVLGKTIASLKLEQKKPGSKISFKELTPEELAREFPQAIFPKDRRAFVEYSAGILFADKCLLAVQSQFKKLGGVLRDGFAVTKIEPGRIVKINGSFRGKEVTVAADKVALCPGPWAKKMIEPLLRNQSLPVKAFRVPVFYWKIKENGCGAIDVIYKDRGVGDFWSIPEIEYKNMVKYSSNVILFEIDPDERDLRADQSVPPELAEHLRNHFPGIEETPSITETCIYTMTPDEISIIDVIPGSDNIAYACGFSGSGFKKAPSVGLMLQQLLNPADKKIFDMAPFSLSRFSINKNKL